MFNLRQIMQLQDEREAEEARAARERRAAEERAQIRAAEQARAAEAERALREREAAERAVTARETALLRLQLGAAAAQRAEDERLSHAQRELADVRNEAHALAARLRRRSALWAVVGATLAGVGVWRMAESQAAASARHAAALAGLQAREVADLRARVSQLSAAAGAPHAMTQPTQVLTRLAKPVVRTPHQPLIKHKPVPAHTVDELLRELDDDNRDPLGDLPLTR